MVESPPPPTSTHRLLPGVLIALALIYPLWSRMVDATWDGLFGPRVVVVVDGPSGQRLQPFSPAAVDPSPPDMPPPAGRLSDSIVRDEAPPRPVVDEPAPEPADEPVREPVAEPEPVASPPPEVLGAYTGGTEPQVLVDMHGLDDVRSVIDDVCRQAQAFVDYSLSGQRIRIQSHEGELPSRDLGVLRCP